MGNSLQVFMNYLGLSYYKKEARILMVGLDGVGKTSILYKMKLGEVVTTIPTIGFNVETINLKNLTITVWDVGGRDKCNFWIYDEYNLKFENENENFY